MTTPAGWYPDPSGRWEFRWFDGTAWASAVATGAFQSTEPYPPPPDVAMDESVAIFDVEAVHGREPARLRLTWSHAVFIPTRRPHETRWIPLGYVAGVDVEKSNDATSPGTIRLRVRGPGYVGPSVFVLSDVPAAHQIRAAALRQRAVVTGIPVTS